MGLPRLRSLSLAVAVVSLCLCQASPPDIYQLNSIPSLPSGLLSSLISSPCYCLLLMRPVSVVSHFSCNLPALPSLLLLSTSSSFRCFHLPTPIVNTYISSSSLSSYPSLVSSSSIFATRGLADIRFTLPPMLAMCQYLNFCSR